MDGVGGTAVRRGWRGIFGWYVKTKQRNTQTQVNKQKGCQLLTEALNKEETKWMTNFGVLFAANTTQAVKSTIFRFYKTI